VYPDEARTIEELIRLSDSAMYSWRRQRMTAPDGRIAAPLARLRAAEMASELIPLLTSSSNLDAKLRLVAHHLSIGAGYDAVQFVLSREGEPPSVTTFGIQPDLVADWQQEISDRAGAPHPIFEAFRRHQRPLIIDDPWNDERLLKAQRAIIQRAGLRSVMVAPMIWEGKNIGVLGVASKREHAFSPPDAQFLNTVATQVTAIARMARLVEDLGPSANRPAA
jgi:GAF domain-containing protein